MDRSVNDLFAETDDVYWFVLPLEQNTTFAALKKENIVKYLKTDLAVRLSLEYNKMKINTLIVLPTSLISNTSLPVINLTTQVDEQVDIAFGTRSSNSSSLRHELNGLNMTVVDLSGLSYYVLQLLSFK